MCLADGTSQGDDTVHQPAHLSAHRCHYHRLTGVWVVVEYWEINWIKWGWTQCDCAPAFIRIDENIINGPVITTCTRHPGSRLEYSCVNRPSNRRCVLMELLLRYARVSFTSSVCLFSFPCPRKSKLPPILSFCRPGPHHVEWPLHGRENRYPVDPAQRSLLLCCPVSRWLNISGAVILVTSSCLQPWESQHEDPPLCSLTYADWLETDWESGDRNFQRYVNTAL